MSKVGGRRGIRAGLKLLTGKQQLKWFYFVLVFFNSYFRQDGYSLPRLTIVMPWVHVQATAYTLGSYKI